MFLSHTFFCCTPLPIIPLLPSPLTFPDPFLFSLCLPFFLFFLSLSFLLLLSLTMLREMMTDPTEKSFCALFLFVSSGKYQIIAVNDTGVDVDAIFFDASLSSHPPPRYLSFVVFLFLSLCVCVPFLCVSSDENQIIAVSDTVVDGDLIFFSFLSFPFLSFPFLSFPFLSLSVFQAKIKLLQ